MFYFKKISKNIIFIILWILIIFNFISAEMEFSEIIDINNDLLLKMLFIHSTLLLGYIIFTFLFRKSMSQFFLVLNTTLWILMSISPIFNWGIIFKNIAIFERTILIYNVSTLIYIYALYINTFYKKRQLEISDTFKKK